MFGFVVTCEKWLFGKCMKITLARAEHKKQYKCPAHITATRELYFVIIILPFL